MFDKLLHVNIESCTDSELLALIRRTLPAILQICRQVLDKRPQFCKDCEKYGTCTELCELVKSQLPAAEAGRNSKGKTYGDLIKEFCDDNDGSQRKYDHEYLKAIDRIRADEIFMLYENCVIIFTQREWRVVTMKVRDGLTFEEIGQTLGIAISTASDTFQRAKKKMENHYSRKHGEINT